MGDIIKFPKVKKESNVIGFAVDTSIWDDLHKVEPIKEKPKLEIIPEKDKE